MNETLALPFGVTIAGLKFYCDGCLPPLGQDAPVFYKHFIHSANADDVSSFISLSPLDGLSLPEGTPTFDASPTWSIYGDRDSGWEIVRHTGDMPRFGPAYIARCTGDMSRIHIYLNTLLPAHTGKAANNPFSYPLDQIVINQLLATHQGILVHAACALVDGEAILFPGCSGAGKSTISGILESAPEKYVILSDDRVILRPGPTGLIAHGTPWPGEGGHASQMQAPLRAICFLEKADAAELLPISPAESAERLLQVASVPWYDQTARDQALDFIDLLCGTVELKRLAFAPDEGVLKVLKTLHKDS